MRRLLPFALLVVACAKSPEAPKEAVPAAAVPSATEMTPESVARSADVPLYPGADAPENMSTMPEHRNDGSTHYSLVLATGDSVKKAADFYSQSLKAPAKPGMGGLSIFTKSAKGNDVSVVVAPEAGRTLIRIKSIAYASKP